jgi:oxygen-independent coproporphyrinogen-3 oxidase
MHSLYIHWPFCPYRCHFCPFVAYIQKDSLLEPYHQKMKKEIEIFGQKLPEKLDLQTIYFGGGTPSTYPDNLLLDTFATLKKIANFDEHTEITIEVNPGTVTREKLELWQKLGINRLSIGVQSLNERALKEVNRLQTTEDVFAALQLAQGLFENVSVDFILGLPNVTPEQWKEQMRQVVQWPITHVSVYFLMVHEFTPLYYRVQKKMLELAPDEELVKLYSWTVDFLREHGIEQYEVSNFAKTGFESRHNRSYWGRKPFKGFGVGAWSFDGMRRFRNKKNLMLYMNEADKDDESVIEFSEMLSEEQASLEKIMLDIRQAHGLSRSYYFEHISPDAHHEAQERIEQMCTNGLLRIEDDRIKLTARGCAVEQEIIAQLSL